MISVRDTLLIPDDRGNEHLFVVIAKDEKREAVLLVNFTSSRIGGDHTCVVGANEHPFLKYDSTINYADARITPIRNIEYNLEKKTFKKHFPVSKGLLKKIQDGALNSHSIPIKCSRFLAENA